MALVSSACIVSDPAEYGVAKQSPPFLNATEASPSVLHRKDLNSGEVLSVNVDVRSEDAGDDLIAQLFLDYAVVNKQELLGFRELPPGKFDKERPIAIPAQIQRPGCHAVSLVVTHRGNLTDNNVPIRAEDTAILTWWVNVDDDGQNKVSDCPASGGAN